MAFHADLAEMLGARVLGADGRLVGRLADLAADCDDPHPTVMGLVVRRRWARALVPVEAVAEWGTREIHLLAGAAPGPVPDAAALLRRDVLDTQIVDFRERHVTRVSDVMLESQRGRLKVVGVDVGAAPSRAASASAAPRDGSASAGSPGRSFTHSTTARGRS